MILETLLKIYFPFLNLKKKKKNSFINFVKSFFNNLGKNRDENRTFLKNLGIENKFLVKFKYINKTFSIVKKCKMNFSIVWKRKMNFLKFRDEKRTFEKI